MNALAVAAISREIAAGIDQLMLTHLTYERNGGSNDSRS